MHFISLLFHQHNQYIRKKEKKILAIRCSSSQDYWSLRKQKPAPENRSLENLSILPKFTNDVKEKTITMNLVTRGEENGTINYSSVSTPSRPRLHSFLIASPSPFVPPQMRRGVRWMSKWWRWRRERMWRWCVRWTPSLRQTASPGLSTALRTACKQCQRARWVCCKRCCLFHLILERDTQGLMRSSQDARRERQDSGAPR